MTLIENIYQMNLEGRSISSLIGAVQKLAQEIDRQKCAYETAIEPLEIAKIKLEGAIADEMDKQGVKNAPTEYGTAYFSHILKPKVVDREIYLRWVVDNEAFDLITNHVAKEALKDMGEYPPGLQVDTFRKLNIRSR
jgi:hypothetical protein